MRQTKSVIWMMLGVLLPVLGLVLPASAGKYDSWRWTPLPGRLNQARWGSIGSQTPKLLGGRTFIVGGWADVAGTVPLLTTEIYEPSGGTWSLTKNDISSPTAGAGLVRLQDGRLLLCGGQVGSNDSTTRAEIFDPATLLWTPVTPMNQKRRQFSAIVLPDGKVLVVGGRGGTEYLNSAEIYDPGQKTWTFTAAMAVARQTPGITFLPNGRQILAVGGVGASGMLSSAEIYSYDSQTGVGSWSSAADLIPARTGAFNLCLISGKILNFGGYITSWVLSRDAQLYDPVNNAWSPTGNLNQAREAFSYGPIRYIWNGVLNFYSDYLIAGGRSGGVVLKTTEIYEMNAGTWNFSGSLNTARFGARTSGLPDGRLFVAGGCDGTKVLDTMEIFAGPPVSQPYLLLLLQ